MKDVQVKARKAFQCVLAGRTCMLVVSNLAVLELEDVQDFCSAVGHSCIRHGCRKAGNACLAAGDAKTEEEFLKHCKVAGESCKKSTMRTGKKSAKPNSLPIYLS